MTEFAKIERGCERINGDGWNDLVSVGLPGSPAVLYLNPGEGKVLEATNYWKTHKVFEGVGNESPQFVNLIGDEQPELVCNHLGKFGYATFDVKKPAEPWAWHAISDEVGQYPFGHGLGVGDINGDGRQDVICKDGWQDTHEVLNAFIWGPDGWLYGCHGVFTHSKVGKPGTPNEQRQGLNAGVWR